MPSELFWLLVWWSVWFLFMLVWYDAKKKEPLTPMVALVMFLLSGFAPIVAVMFAIKKLTSRDK